MQINKDVGTSFGRPRFDIDRQNAQPPAIDYSRLLDKIIPRPDGEGQLSLRTGVVSAVNSDGTVDVSISGLVVPDVPRLDSGAMASGAVVSILVTRGQALVLGPVASTGGQGGSLGLRKSTSTLSATNATFVKDTGVGDLAFTAVDGHRYRISYRARMAGSGGTNQAGDVRLLDGGASSPTNGSTNRGSAHNYLPTDGGIGQSNVVLDVWLDCPTDITAGVHTMAVFYGRTGGGNNVVLNQSTGQERTFSIYDEGPAYNRS